MFVSDELTGNVCRANYSYPGLVSAFRFTKKDKRTSEPKHCKTNTQRTGLLKKPCATRCEIFHFATVLLQTMQLNTKELHLMLHSVAACSAKHLLCFRSTSEVTDNQRRSASYDPNTFFAKWV